MTKTSDQTLHSNGLDTLTIAVISDLHAFDQKPKKGEEPPSYLCTTDPEDQISRHPIAGLLHLISTTSLKADLLLCCGDMGDKARPAGIRYVWERLSKIKEALGASFLAATPGNHDVDSRYKYNEYDAKGFLQSLLPRFPLGNDIQNNEFWARNYVILTEPRYRLLLLNTSAYHGNGDEFEHGRIARRTVEAIREDLQGLEQTAPRLVNILLCHHHPIKNEDIDDMDYSEMKGGSELLNVLGSGNLGNWIVIHGHKHHPKICYAAGDSSAPVIFSAGSFSAKLYADLQPNARNQFYIIRFPLSRLAGLGLGLAGTFQSWDWSFGGWKPANEGSGLPAHGGFGSKQDVSAAASQVAQTLAKSGLPFMNWGEIASSFPTLEFLLPTSFRVFLSRLDKEHDINILYQDSQPFQLAMRGNK